MAAATKRDDFNMSTYVQNRIISRLTAAGLCIGMVLTIAGAENVTEVPASFGELNTRYAGSVRPLLKTFCLQCHSTKLKQGDLDLERFTDLDRVRSDPRIWQKVEEMIRTGEMPPEDSKQPALVQRNNLRTWVVQYLRAEALAGAGDPGPVVLRRLNNAEFTYTIRDLIGIDSIEPAREFPADGAAGEGFTNAGNALVMSPGLLRKYLDAGKYIAAHAVMVPNGFRFSTSTTQRDWTNEILSEIRALYGEFSVVERLADHYGHGMSHLGNAGRIPLERYFAATLAEQDSLTADNRTIEDVAREHGLNARYLGILWTNLTGHNRSLLLDDLRSRWRRAKPRDAAALAEYISTWQKGLWTFNPVGVMGRKGSRSQWLEPVNPLLTQQELRFQIPATKDGQTAKEFVVSLVATDAGDGNKHDFVIWKKPRLVADGKPNILLRDVLNPDSQAKDSTAEEKPADSQATDSQQRIPALTLQASMFGKHPNGTAIDPASLCVRAPAMITIRLPAKVALGREFVTTAILEKKTAAEGSVQVELVEGEASPRSGLLPSEVIVKFSDVDVGADKRTVSYRRPILISENNKSRKRLELAMGDFRAVFPAALCYTQIVPVDEILTLTLFYREDDHLARLMLDDAQKAHLDKLWKELRYVSREPLRLVDVLDSLLEAIVDGPQAGIFDPAIKPLNKRAAGFRKMLVKSETKHLDALVAFARRAWRRPTTDQEEKELRRLYRWLCELELPHEEAFRLTLARVFVASPFLYRLEVAPDGALAAPVSDWELASRLSYFLWSSMPDDELRAVAANGTLREPAVLARQTRRMLEGARVRRLATEFACQWLHIHEFDSTEKKSEKHFSQFAELRSDMYEESIRFLTDLFQNDGSLLSLLNADHTFVNERLATFYGVPIDLQPQPRTNREPAGVTNLAFSNALNDGWWRVDGIQQHGRGGILGFASTLAKQSGATRTSPILRGNWISEVLLGEKLPNPPKNVPQLADTFPAGLTERQLIERHSSDAACAKCHARIDPFGFALEGFDGIGRRREKNTAGLPVNTRTILPDGTPIEGLSGLRDYLLTKRQDEFFRQFFGKLLGYALGRELQLSDRPLIDEMLNRLAENDYRFSIAAETIVLSDQFRMIRGKLFNR